MCVRTYAVTKEELQSYLLQYHVVTMFTIWNFAVIVIHIHDYEYKKKNRNWEGWWVSLYLSLWIHQYTANI